MSKTNTMLTQEQKNGLLKAAWDAMEYSYSPYSNFQVGAALLGVSGTVYTGCNIENIAYGPSNCAERTAFFKAVSQGEKEFTAIAVVGEHRDEPGQNMDFTYPCGVCRQVMLEFCDPKTFLVVFGNRGNQQQVHTLEEIIPYGFSAF